MALDKKLTLADFLPSGGLVAPPDTTMALLSKGFYTCGAGCPDPRGCLANEHCERGFTSPLPVYDAAQSADRLTAAHTKLGVALKEAGAALEAEQYVKRDDEFAAWYSGLDLLQKESRTAALKIAFNAGWTARKKIDFEMAYGLDKSKAE